MMVIAMSQIFAPAFYRLILTCIQIPFGQHIDYIILNIT